MNLNHYYCTKDQEVHNDVIDISIYFNLECQLRCYYCYSQEEFGKQWKSQHLSEDLIDKLYDGISQSSEIFVLSLLGGEPTLYPNLSKFIEKFSDLPNVRQINLYTNSIKPLDFLPITPKLWVCLTHHPSQHNESHILKNIRTLQSLGIRFRVNLMLIERYKEQIQNFYNLTKPLGVDYEITFLEFKGKLFLDQNIIPELENEKVCVFNNKQFSLIEFYQKYGSKKFKLCICHINDYTLNLDGTLQHMCTLDKVNIDDLKDLKIKKVLCPWGMCNDTCYAKFRKEIVYK